LQDPLPAELLAVPVQAKMADNRPQPGRKRCGTCQVEPAELAEAVLAQTFANKEKTIGDMVVFSFKEPDDLQNERGIKLEKLSSGAMRLIGMETTKESGNLRTFHRNCPWRRSRSTHI